jgi:hypothetical protein
MPKKMPTLHEIICKFREKLQEFAKNNRKKVSLIAPIYSYLIPALRKLCRGKKGTQEKRKSNLDSDKRFLDHKQQHEKETA